MKTQRWDLFCRVIDNFGDIGVCWRLARQLRDEYALNVRLWLDDLSVASRLINGLNPSLNSQIANGVEVCLWSSDEDFVDILPADVVIEAFACELPQPYIRNMVQTKPTWLNLEYLSAEKWVDDFHAQQSIHPATGLKKTFFFPGFTAKTGGLLREHHLKSARAVFKTTEFWGQLGIAPVESSIKISLFCYPHAPIKDLLNSISQGTQPTHCFVPNTTILPVVAEYFGKAALKVGETVSHKQLTITVLPFLSQNEYDHLLWACDLNFVRGEDSWIRALWAAKPFVWQTYQQDENLHLAKLKAFFDTYQPAPCLADFNRAWLEGQIHQAPWDQLIGKLPILKKHAEKQTHEFEKQADLAANLVIFSKNQV